MAQVVLLYKNKFIKLNGILISTLTRNLNRNFSAEEIRELGPKTTNQLRNIIERIQINEFESCEYMSTQALDNNLRNALSLCMHHQNNANILITGQIIVDSCEYLRMKWWADKLGYSLFNTNLWGTAVVKNQAEICCTQFRNLIQRATQAMETMVLIDNNPAISNIQKEIICLSFESKDLLESALGFASSYLFLPDDSFGYPQAASTPNRSRNPSRTE